MKTNARLIMAVARISVKTFLALTFAAVLRVWAWTLTTETALVSDLYRASNEFLVLNASFETTFSASVLIPRVSQLFIFFVSFSSFINKLLNLWKSFMHQKCCFSKFVILFSDNFIFDRVFRRKMFLGLTMFCSGLSINFAHVFWKLEAVQNGCLFV